MAFSLGSIFVELTCNTAKFLSGMDKASLAAKKTGKDIRGGLGVVGDALANLGDSGARIGAVLQGVGDKAGEAFNVAANKGRGFGLLVTGSILGGVTALGGGMFALAAHAAEVGSKIFEASEKTGIGASQMSGLMAIAKETGGNFDSLTTSLARAGANLAKAIIEPGGESAKILAQVMGGSKALADLGLKPMGDRVQVVMARIFAMNDVGQRNAALSTLLGRGWQENVSTLRLLAQQGYGPAIEQAKKLGVYFDAAHAAQAKQFKSAMSIMTGEFSALAVAIGEKAIPMFSKLFQMLQGMGHSAAATGHALAAVGFASEGMFSAAAEQWRKYREEANADTQAQTDFAVHLQSLTAGERAATETGKGLTATTKEHADILAQLIEREKDELVTLDTHGKAEREIQAEYQRTTREIAKAVAAGGSYTESLEAQGLALDIYKKKLLEIPPVLPKLPNLFAKPEEPSLTVPAHGGTMPAAIGGTLPSLGQTLSQLAQLSGTTDSTRGAFKALREETELSDASFKKLAAAFPGLTEAEVAATAAGRRLIAQLTKLDQLGTASEQFTEFKNKLITDGDNLAGHLIQTMGGALDQLENQFAHLAVTGKANFKQIYQSIAESLVKTGLQKGVSSLLGHLGVSAGGGKPDGTSGNPMWVRMANKLPGGLGGLFGKGSGAGGEGSGDNGENGGSSLPGGLSQMLGGLGSFAKTFGSLFGGFLATGGDVTPGRAYVVGEKHPEFFLPRASGAVVPSLATQQLRPIHYAPVYNINTPNADSFRRSQGQIITEAVRGMALAHARNS